MTASIKPFLPRLPRAAPLTRRLFGAALAILAALPVTAQGLPDGPLAEARLLPGWRAKDGQHVAALEITMPAGWHTYWRAPGDAGIPPLFDWSGSRGIASVAIGWPVPQVFDTGGMRSLGYEDRVVLPLRITLRDGVDPQLAVRGALGVCLDICVPAEISARVELPASGKRDGRIAAALADRPLNATEAGARATCTLSPSSDGVIVEARLTLPGTSPRDHAVIESSNPKHWVSVPEVTHSATGLTLRAEIAHVEGGTVALDRAGLRFTVLGKTRAVDIRGCTGS